MEVVTVYTLKSSRDGKIRYVGQTTDLPEARYRSHMASARRARGVLGRWMQAEIGAGYKILMGIVTESGVLNETERRVIARLREAGYDLLNATRGGGTVLDRRYRPMTAEHKRKISEAMRGRKHSAEAKIKLSIAGTERSLAEIRTHYPGHRYSSDTARRAPITR